MLVIVVKRELAALQKMKKQRHVLIHLSGGWKSSIRFAFALDALKHVTPGTATVFLERYHVLIAARLIRVKWYYEQLRTLILAVINHVQVIDIKDILTIFFSPWIHD